MATFKSFPAAILLWLLALITVLSFLWPTYRSFLNISIDPNEAFNAYFADAAMGRMSLYPSRDKLITNNYPPLSFYVVGGVGKLLGDPILAGRLLSLLALAVSAGGVAFAVKHFGGNNVAASVGLLYFVATMCRFFAAYVGMNDPHLLGQAVMTVGFATFLRAARVNGSFVGPVLLMVTAGFIKHNIIAMPVTAMLWLSLNKPQKALTSGLVGVGAIGLGFALCAVFFGADFFVNFFCPRQYRLSRFFHMVGQLQWIVVGAAAWLYVGTTRRSHSGVSFCNLLVLVAFLSFIGQTIGDGVDCNCMFELVFAVSIGVGIAYGQVNDLQLVKSISPAQLRFLFLLAICSRLLATSRLEPIRLWTDRSFHAEIAARESAMAATVARIRATDGDVIPCFIPCYRAGKPYVFDSFHIKHRIMAGELPANIVTNGVAAKRWTIVEQH